MLDMLAISLLHAQLLTRDFDRGVRDIRIQYQTHVCISSRRVQRVSWPLASRGDRTADAKRLGCTEPDRPLAPTHSSPCSCA